MAQMAQTRSRASRARISSTFPRTGLCHLHLPWPVLLLLFLLGVSAIAWQAPHFFPHTLTFEGTLTRADYERLFEQAFDVPAGTRRIELVVTHSGADRRTVLDVGLRGPSGFRGWSGGRRETIDVSALTATPGYLPGPIEPGRWAVVVGVPNIREGSQDRFTITLTLHDTDRPSPSRVIRSGPGWFVGDLHAHSGHSDGRVRVGSPRAAGAPPHRVFDAALSAGLDFVTLSDHNTVAHWLDVDRLQPYYDTLLLLHGREVTTYRGHANTAGEPAFHDFRLASPADSPEPLLRTIAVSGAFVSINHPGRPDDESCMGCGWNVADDGVLGAVHGVEVVNGMTRSGPEWGWPIWAAWLNRGARLTAVGGSDEHTPDEPEDYRIGQPATVVWARELSETAIVDGLKSGRVYIRTRGPDGPALEFEAEAGGVRYPMGAVIPAGPLRLSATITGADGQELQWIRNGSAMATGIVVSGAAERRVDARSGDWFALVVRDAGDPSLISNAIYVGK